MSYNSDTKEETRRKLNKKSGLNITGIVIVPFIALVSLYYYYTFSSLKNYKIHSIKEFNDSSYPLYIILLLCIISLSLLINNEVNINKELKNL
jgi:hypothetical protein